MVSLFHAFLSHVHQSRKYVFTLIYPICRLLFIDKLCGLPGYKPGDSLYWNVPWTRLGSCSGTISPSSSPVYMDMADVGGCPEEFSETNKYIEGDRVSLNGIVLKCKEWPYSVYCNSEGYEPLGQKSDTAWVAVGHWYVLRFILREYSYYSHNSHILFVI